MTIQSILKCKFHMVHGSWSMYMSVGKWPAEDRHLPNAYTWTMLHGPYEIYIWKKASPQLFFEAVPLQFVDQALVAEAQDFCGATPIAIGLAHRVADHLDFERRDAILQCLLFARFLSRFGFALRQTL